MKSLTARRIAFYNRLDRLQGSPPKWFERLISRWFHRIFYYQMNRTWADTYFLGVPVLNNPLDLWVIQEIIFEIRPDLIIETGTSYGGSSYYMARLLDLIGSGHIITIDIMRNGSPPQHPRITHLIGSSTSPEIFRQVKEQIKDTMKVLVVLDSDHSEAHVAEEMRLYSTLVSPGSYLIVEDTNVNGHPAFYAHGPGPAEAAREFLKEHPEFEADRSREKYFMTLNPGGYLRRLSSS